MRRITRGNLPQWGEVPHDPRSCYRCPSARRASARVRGEGEWMTPELATRLAGRRVVASVSGGKDSAALSLWLKEQEIEHERVFMDTGWEHPATYEYLRGELPRVIGPIITLRSEGFEALVRRKKMFPSGRYQFCSNELKLKPL